MVLSVERAGVIVAHHRDVSSEVDVGFKTGVEISHALFVDEFAEHLPFVGVLDEYRAVLVPTRHNEGVREGGRLVEIGLFLREGDGRLACRAAELEPEVIVAEDGIVAAGNAEGPISMKIPAALCFAIIEIVTYAVRGIVENHVGQAF